MGGLTGEQATGIPIVFMLHRFVGLDNRRRRRLNGFTTRT
jgi:hypothetical protein